MSVLESYKQPITLPNNVISITWYEHQFSLFMAQFKRKIKLIIMSTLLGYCGSNSKQFYLPFEKITNVNHHYGDRNTIGTSMGKTVVSNCVINNLLVVFSIIQLLTSWFVVVASYCDAVPVNANAGTADALSNSPYRYQHNTSAC